MALESFGAKVIWQCDSDPFCRKVLARHWPHVPRYEDVRHIDDSTPRPDVLCGGFPCQPVSLAGKRQGHDDARWLWPEFARIIGCLRPDAVFLENVPGLRTLGLRYVLADLAGLGFDAEWGCFRAADVGAPHLRNRLFLLSYANGAKLRKQSGGGGRSSWKGPSVVGIDGAPGDVADPNREGKLQPGWSQQEERKRIGYGDRWAVEPAICRMAHGVPDRVDRLRALGNAVVPACAALAFEALRALIPR